MIVLPRTMLTAALLALTCSVAAAQSGAADGAPLAACRPDLTKLCPNATGGQRGDCLEKNTAKLSPACATAFADLNAKTKAMRDACADDVKTHCATAAKDKGGRAIVQCLRSNTAKLSTACNAAITARYGAP